MFPMYLQCIHTLLLIQMAELLPVTLKGQKFPLTLAS